MPSQYNKLREAIRQEIKSILGEDISPYSTESLSMKIVRPLKKRFPNLSFEAMGNTEFQEMFQKYPELRGYYAAGAIHRDLFAEIIVLEHGNFTVVFTEDDEVISEYPATDMRDVMRYMDRYL